MTTSDRAPEVDLFVDTGPIDWDAIPSDQSYHGHDLEAGEIEQTDEERLQQAARSEEMEREAEQKAREEKRRLEEQEKERKSKQTQQRDAHNQRDIYRRGNQHRGRDDAEDHRWKKKNKKKKNAETIACQLCNVKITGRAAYEAHVKGQKHKRKERNSSLNAVNSDLNSHYRRATAISEASTPPSNDREDEDEEQSRDAYIQTHTSAPDSSHPSDSRNYMPPPICHPHQEHVKPRDSPVTADPRPLSPPVVSPRPSTAFIANLSSDDVVVPPSFPTFSPARPTVAPQAERQQDLTSSSPPPPMGQPASVGVATVDRSVEPEKNSSTGDAYAGQTAETVNTDGAGSAAVAAKVVPKPPAPAPHSTAEEVNKLADKPVASAMVQPPVSGAAQAADNRGNVPMSFDVSATEGPAKSTATITATIAQKTSGRAFNSIVTPRPFVKTGPRKKPDGGKSSTDGKRSGASDSTNPPPKSGPSLSNISELPGPNPRSAFPMRHTAMRFAGHSSPEARVGDKNLNPGLQASAVAGEKVTDSSRAGFMEPREPATTGGIPPHTSEKSTVGGSEPGRPATTGEVARLAPESNTVGGSSGPSHNDRGPTSLEAPDLPGSRAPHSTAAAAVPSSKLMLRSTPKPSENERKRKRLENNEDGDRAEGRPTDRSHGDERRTSSGDRRYEEIGSQRRRLDDGSDRESRRRDRYKDRDHDDRMGRDSWREDRRGRDELRDDTRGRDEDRRGRDEPRDDRRKRDDLRDDRRGREDSREDRRARDDRREERRGRDDSREDRRGRDDRREDRRGRDDPRDERRRSTVEVPRSAIPTPPVPQTPAPDFTKYPLVPQEWREAKMSVAEWRELRQFALIRGSDVDKLAYKMMQEILLSPVVGIDFHNLAPFSRALLDSVKNFYFADGKVFARYSDYPTALIYGDPKYKSEMKEDEDWSRQQTPEYLALCNVHDNIMFSFNPDVDPPVNNSNVGDCSDLPPRGSYGAKSQRKGPGKFYDGMRAPRYPDAVSEDPLFKRIAAYVNSRNRGQGNDQHYQR